jgi:hypothetical protein
MTSMTITTMTMTMMMNGCLRIWSLRAVMMGMEKEAVGRVWPGRKGKGRRPDSRPRERSILIRRLEN